MVAVCAMIRPITMVVVVAVLMTKTIALAVAAYRATGCEDKAGGHKYAKRKQQQ